MEIATRQAKGRRGSMNRRRLLLRILNGSRNVAFSDFVNLIEGFGFRLSRVRGSHHIYVHPSIPELVNLQDVGGQVKPYQVRQTLKLIERHHLTLTDDSGEGSEEAP
jgi:predicted RNA binding protein YcfA (HicA-like mRNA interferase family)